MRILHANHLVTPLGCTTLCTMVGPLLSVLLMGMLPVSGIVRAQRMRPEQIAVASPLLTADASQVSPLRLAAPLSASGVVIVDLDSGQTVFSLDPDTARPMASLTKLMTALLIVEGHEMGEWVWVPDDVFDPEVTMLHLPLGNQFRVGDLLKALLIGSSNEAAVTLARFHSDTVDSFVAQMNQRARELGLAGTTFANPTGFDAPEQRATPRDLAWLAMYVLRKPEIRARMATNASTIVSRSGETVDLIHTHQMLRSNGTIVAGKTGTTDDARQCLLSIVRLDGRTYVTVLLHSSDRYADMRTIVAALSSLR